MSSHTVLNFSVQNTAHNIVHKAPKKKKETWQTISDTRPLTRLCLFADAASLARVLATCRAWSAAATSSAVQEHWKKLYLRAFELTTTVGTALAVKGDETTWSQRYAERAKIEAHWLLGNCMRNTLELDPG